MMATSTGFFTVSYSSETRLLRDVNLISHSARSAISSLDRKRRVLFTGHM